MPPYTPYQSLEGETAVDYQLPEQKMSWPNALQQLAWNYVEGAGDMVGRMYGGLDVDKYAPMQYPQGVVDDAQLGAEMMGAQQQQAEGHSGLAELVATLGGTRLAGGAINKAAGVHGDPNTLESFNLWHGGHDFPPEVEVRMPDGSTQRVKGERNPDAIQQEGIDNTWFPPKTPEGAEVLREDPLGRFDMSKGFTGEGNQVYGEGHYNAQRMGTAKSYKNKVQKDLDEKASIPDKPDPYYQRVYDKDPDSYLTAESDLPHDPYEQAFMFSQAAEQLDGEDIADSIEMAREYMLSPEGFDDNRFKFTDQNPDQYYGPEASTEWIFDRADKYSSGELPWPTREVARERFPAPAPHQTGGAGIKEYWHSTDADAMALGIAAQRSMTPEIMDKFAPNKLQNQAELDDYEIAVKDYMARLDAGELPKPTRARLYKTEIDAEPEDFLETDVPLIKQSEGVIDKINKDPELWALYDELIDTDSDADAFYKAIANRMYEGSEADASKHLNEFTGIPGLRYEDYGRTRNKPEHKKTRNYVLFNDDVAKIIEKYGLAGIGLGGAGLASQMAGDNNEEGTY